MTIEPGIYHGTNTVNTCDMCGREVKKWIQIIPCGKYCIRCSHHILRILMQDIIEYHNGKYVRLHDIMPLYNEPEEDTDKGKSLFDF